MSFVTISSFNQGDKNEDKFDSTDTCSNGYFSNSTVFQ